MKKKFCLLLVLCFFSVGELWACPMCIGGNPDDKYYFWIVGGFILLLHVPMYFLYKVLMKYKDINKIEKMNADHE